MNGKSILDRKVSVQLARKPEPAATGEAENIEGGEGQQRRRSSTRGRGRGRGRGGRSARGGRNGKKEGELNGDATDGATGVLPLTASTNEAASGEAGAEAKDGKTERPRKQRGPPEDGVPSKTKIMVANLPYDLREERVSSHPGHRPHRYIS